MKLQKIAIKVFRWFSGHAPKQDVLKRYQKAKITKITKITRNRKAVEYITKSIKNCQPRERTKTKAGKQFDESAPARETLGGNSAGSQGKLRQAGENGKVTLAAS